MLKKNGEVLSWFPRVSVLVEDFFLEVWPFEEMLMFEKFLKGSISGQGGRNSEQLIPSVFVNSSGQL